MLLVLHLAEPLNRPPNTLPKVVLDNDHLVSLDYGYGNGTLDINIVKAPYKYSNLHYIYITPKLCYTIAIY